MCCTCKSSASAASLNLAISSITYSTLHSRSLSVSLRRSFEEMEAQITAGMKTPVLSSRPGPEGSAGDRGKKRESEALSRTQSAERDEQVSRMLLAKTEAVCSYVVRRGGGEITCHLFVLSPSCEQKVLIWSHILCHCSDTVHTSLKATTCFSVAKNTKFLTKPFNLITNSLLATSSPRPPMNW